MRPIDFEPIWNEYFPGVKPIIEELKDSHEGSKAVGSINDPSRYLYWNEAGLRYGLGVTIMREEPGYLYKHYLELILVTFRPNPAKYERVGRQRREVIPVMDEALVRSAITNMESWVNKK